jgi:hypothetical protein
MVSDFSLKTESFLTRTGRVCKVEDYLLCINDMCEHTKFTIIGWMSGFMNGDMYYRTRYGCNACGYEWMDD